MTDVRVFRTEVGPELLAAIGGGLIIVEADWSAPALVRSRASLYFAVKLGAERVFIVNHDSSARLQELVAGNVSENFRGAGEMIYVKNGSIANFFWRCCRIPDQIVDLRSLVGLTSR